MSHAIAAVAAVAVSGISQRRDAVHHDGAASVGAGALFAIAASII
jgi:hypothetical protein